LIDNGVQIEIGTLGANSLEEFYEEKEDVFYDPGIAN